LDSKAKEKTRATESELARQTQAGFFAALHRFLFGSYFLKLDTADVTKGDWEVPFVSELNDQIYKESISASDVTCMRAGVTSRSMEAKALAINRMKMGLNKILKERMTWDA
jgi:hypothetical protein